MVIQPDTWCSTVLAAAAALQFHFTSLQTEAHLRTALLASLLQSQNQQIIETTPEDSYRLRLPGGFGFENLVSDPYSQYWSDFTIHQSSASRPGLIIGAGIVSSPALEVLAFNPNTKVFLNDLHARHLGYFWALHNDQQLRRIIPVPGHFPNDIDFPDGSLSSVLTNRVLHFLSPEEMELGIRKIARWLRPGGRWIVAEDGPLFAATPVSTILKYQEAYRRGALYPGYLPTHEWFPGARGSFLPRMMNIFHPNVLLARTRPHGFGTRPMGRTRAVKSVGVFSRPHYPPDISALQIIDPQLVRLFRQHLRNESWGCVLIKEGRP